jgi:hypothetical protein
MTEVDLMKIQIILIILFPMLLCGCIYPFPNNNNSFLTATAWMEFTLTAKAGQTSSPEIDSGLVGQCYYNWGTKSLPEESQLIQNGLLTAGIQFTSAIAEAYGENCIDSITHLPLGFSVLETDFRITLSIEEIENDKELGDVIYQVTKTILDFPDGTFPGSSKGYVSFQFNSGSSLKNFWFPIASIETDIKNGVKGINLLTKISP